MRLRQARAADAEELQQRQPKLRSISGPESGSYSPYSRPAGAAGGGSPADPGFASTRASSVGTDTRFGYRPFLSDIVQPQLLADQQVLQQPQPQEEDVQQPQERRHSLQSISDLRGRLSEPSLAASAATSSQVPQSSSRQTTQAEGAPATGQGKQKRKYRSRLNIPQRPFLAAATAARMEAARMVQQAEESPEAGIHSAPASANTSPNLGGVTLGGGSGGTRTVAASSYPALLGSASLRTGVGMTQLPGTPVTPLPDTTPGAADQQGATWQYPATCLESPSLEDVASRTPGGQHRHTP